MTLAACLEAQTYLLLTEFEGHTEGYNLSLFSIDS